MKKYNFFSILFILFISGCVQNNKFADFNKYVDPFIGTDAHGHTYPGALVPWGMVQLSPDTDNKNWDWCSGYHSFDNSIMGFSHTHLSGTGIPEMGDILIMPLTGDPIFNPGRKENPDEGYRSKFSKETESARPGYYSVRLEDYNICVELTASKRVGFHRYSFSENTDKNKWLIIDLGHGLDDKNVGSRLNVIDGNKVSGYRHSTGFIKNQHIYFCAEFSIPFNDYKTFTDGKTGKQDAIKGEVCKIALDFGKDPGNELLVKIALSTVSEEGALKNLEAEVPHWDFDKVLQNAGNEWEKNLSRIEVDSYNEDVKTIFYTAFYHTMISPNLISDVDGRYRGWDGKLHQSIDEFYTNFSLWDTYRAVHPLLGMVFPEKNTQFINSMLQRYREIGELPINEYGINETFCMIGHHAIPVIADAFINDYGDFDPELAYKAVKHSSMNDTFNFKADWEKYMRYGYLPADSIPVESVSRTLEFAYNDWCVAQMAKKLGNAEDTEYFSNRAEFYKNLFDKETSLMRGRNSDGSWVNPFDPLKVSHASSGGGDYTEANAWQYTWFVPHDIPGLIDLMGGNERFISKLDSLFLFDSDVYGDGLTVDVTGLIGQYAHGNEPCHHVPYLYNYAGMPWKSQEKITEIKNTLYQNSREGLCGNDDCGQMSAWYIYSAIGFYPVCPGSDQYAIGSPSFKKVTLHLPEGKKFEIIADSVNKKNIYVQNIELNNEVIRKYFINTADIQVEGKLKLKMVSKSGE